VYVCVVCVCVCVVCVVGMCMCVVGVCVVCMCVCGVCVCVWLYLYVYCVVYVYVCVWCVCVCVCVCGVCVCVCVDNILTKLDFSFIHAYKRYTFHHSISYYSLGAPTDRHMYHLVSIYFPTWVLCSPFVSVCCWECVQTTHSYWEMKSKVGKCIFTCMQLVIIVLLRNTLIK